MKPASRPDAPLTGDDLFIAAFIVAALAAFVACGPAALDLLAGVL